MRVTFRFTRPVAALCACVLGGVLATSAFGQETATAFTGVTLVDGTGQAPMEEVTLVIKGSRIVVPGSAGSIPAFSSGTQVVDLHGKTIIPGLISAHSHLGLVQGAGEPSAESYTQENVARQLAQYEAYGVTAVMSLGVNRDVLYQWRDEQRQGKLSGADIFTADRGLGVMGGVPPFPVPGDQVYRPANAEEARAAVREMATRNPDLINCGWTTSPARCPRCSRRSAVAEARAAVSEAHAHGLRVAAHVFYLADAKSLVDAGIDILAHSIRDVPVDAAFAKTLRAENVAYIPTLALDESQFVYAEHPSWMQSAFFVQAVDPTLLNRWHSPEYAEKIRTAANTPKTGRLLQWRCKTSKRCARREYS